MGFRLFKNGKDNVQHLPGHGVVPFHLPKLREAVDPVTGDRLRPSERFSRFMQAIIRRWSFIGVITVITIIWWSHPDLFRDKDLIHWNLGASYMALFIESVVGIGMFGQTLRDAVILRKVNASEEKVLAEIQSLREELRQTKGNDNAKQETTN